MTVTLYLNWYLHDETSRRREPPIAGRPFWRWRLVLERYANAAVEQVAAHVDARENPWAD
jgi:hypothetical protein